MFNVIRKIRNTMYHWNETVYSNTPENMVLFFYLNLTPGIL